MEKDNARNIRKKLGICFIAIALLCLLFTNVQSVFALNPSIHPMINTTVTTNKATAYIDYGASFYVSMYVYDLDANIRISDVNQVNVYIDNVNMPNKRIVSKNTHVDVDSTNYSLGKHTVRGEYTTKNYMGNPKDFYIYYPSTLTLDNPAPVSAGSYLDAKATVLDKDNNPYPNKNVSFKLNNTIIGTVSTDENGVAKLHYLVPDDTAAGNVALNAYTVVENNYNARSVSKTLAITSGTKLSTMDNQVGKKGESITLKTCLKKTDGTNYAGQTVDFLIDETKVGSAQTDADGNAAFDYTLDDNLTYGDHDVKAVFQGNTSYAASNTAATLTVQQESKLELNIDQTDPKKAVLAATVKDLATEEGIPGQAVTFHIEESEGKSRNLGDEIGSVTTDSNGVAVFTYDIPTDKAAGDYRVTASIEDNGFLIGSHDTGVLTIQDKKDDPTGNTDKPGGNTNPSNEKEKDGSAKPKKKGSTTVSTSDPSSASTYLSILLLSSLVLALAYRKKTDQ